MNFDLAYMEVLKSFLISEEVRRVRSCHSTIRDRMSGS
jgi:hypothetical protein